MTEVISVTEVDDISQYAPMAECFPDTQRRIEEAAMDILAAHFDNGTMPRFNFMARVALKNGPIVGYRCLTEYTDESLLLRTQ